MSCLHTPPPAIRMSVDLALYRALRAPLLAPNSDAARTATVLQILDGDAVAVAAVLGDPSPSHLAVAELLTSWATSQLFPAKLFANHPPQNPLDPVEHAPFFAAVLSAMLSPGNDPGHFSLAVFNGQAFRYLLVMAANKVGEEYVAAIVSGIAMHQVEDLTDSAPELWSSLQVIGGLATQSTAIRDSLICLGQTYGDGPHGAAIAEALDVAPTELGTLRTAEQRSMQQRVAAQCERIERVGDQLRADLGHPQRRAAAWDTLLDLLGDGIVSPLPFLQNPAIVQGLYRTTPAVAERFTAQDDQLYVSLSLLLVALWLRHPQLREDIQSSLGPICLSAEIHLAELRSKVAEDTLQVSRLALTVSRVQLLIQGKTLDSDGWLQKLAG